MLMQGAKGRSPFEMSFPSPREGIKGLVLSEVEWIGALGRSLTAATHGFPPLSTIWDESQLILAIVLQWDRSLRKNLKAQPQVPVSDAVHSQRSCRVQRGAAPLKNHSLPRGKG